MRLLPLLTLLGLFVGCDRPPEHTGPPSMTWSDVTTDLELPVGIEVFAGEDEDAPLKAWLARVDLRQPGIDVGVVSSDDEDGRESVSDMVRETGACLGVNGGYFYETETSFNHIGLLIADGAFVQSAIPGVYADDIRYRVRRSAVGFDTADSVRVGWVSSRGDSSFWWENPVLNVENEPVLEDESGVGSFWRAQDAVSAGPMIVVDGQQRVATDEEVFFNTPIPNVHPRTAVGVDAAGRLLLMVVDGRQRASRGVSLEELADLMLEFDAVDALNLDGGGSSTLIVRDELINKPAGATYQREVVSGIVVNCS